MRRFALGLVLCLFHVMAIADDAIWKQLQQGGYILLMRHAQTVAGTGDPAGFRLDDCRTQRNLSAEGRLQAQRIGETFRSKGIPLGEIRSSAWCRCMDTAKLAFGGVTVWPALNSFFEERGDGEHQTKEVLAALSSIKTTQNLMLVTHQVNITALTGAYPSSGEIIVVRPPAPNAKELAIVGSIKLP